MVEATNTVRTSTGKEGHESQVKKGFLDTAKCALGIEGERSQEPGGWAPAETPPFRAGVRPAEIRYRSEEVS